MKIRRKHIFIKFLCFLYILTNALPSWANNKITLQLRHIEPSHLAGYYVAIKRGFYEEEGLDVEIKEATETTNVVDEVVSGRAQYGVGTSSLLIERQKGKPVVVLAVIFQQSSNLLVTAYRSPTQNIDEIKGKDVMIGNDVEDILAYLKMEGLESKINRVPRSLGIDDLISGKVFAKTLNCPHPLDELKERGFKYHVYNPHTVGIDFYGDNLFTSEKEVENNPERVKAFLRASLLGWLYVYESPEDAAELLAREYPDKFDAKKLIANIKTLKPYMKSDLVPLGYMHEGRWKFIGQTLTSLGMLKADFNLKGFLYKEPEPKDLKTILISSIIICLLYTS
ncbi:MAG: ABC transporter substrate-binding protein, partial [Thermodesulfovibrionales bacterium]|nr:ABC transporter substrate-binding protein [Thermodesulfovibrionales bacterium]